MQASLCTIEQLLYEEKQADRDLKMENIMLDHAKENVKIVDFGLSNTWDQDHPLKTHCGSPEYAAPELFIVGQTYGPEVDLWSLGVVLYGMATGRLPFLTPRDGELSATEKRRHLLSQINRGLTNYQRKPLIGFSADFQHLVACLLVPNTQKRISLKELKCHPWVAGRHKIRPVDFEFSRLSSIERVSIMKCIADQLHIDVYKIDIQLSLNNFGAVGGMYNILSHRQFTLSKEIRGMMWSTPSITTPMTTFKAKTLRSQSVGRQNTSPASGSKVVIRPKTAIPKEDTTISKPLHRSRSSCRKSALRPITSEKILNHTSSYQSRITLTGRPIKEAWNSHPEPHSSLHVVGSQGVKHCFNEKSANQASQVLKPAWENRIQSSRLHHEVTPRNILDHLCASAQPQPNNTARRVKDRPNTTIGNLGVTQVKKTPCWPQSIITTSASTSSKAARDLMDLSGSKKQGSSLSSSRTSPTFKIRRPLIHHSRSALNYKI